MPRASALPRESASGCMWARRVTSEASASTSAAVRKGSAAKCAPRDDSSRPDGAYPPPSPHMGGTVKGDMWRDPLGTEASVPSGTRPWFLMVLEEVPMAIVGGLDLHRKGITLVVLDTVSGEGRP